MSEASDKSLLLRTHKGDEQAARSLWERFAPRLLAFARVMSRDHADDVVQQVFCTILARRRSELRRVEDVTAWLFRLTRNSAINHARTESREHARRANAATPSRPTTHDAELLSAIESLTPEQREVVVLRHIGGLTFDQIALAIDVNRNTAATRHRAAMARLRELLETEPMMTEAREVVP